MPDTLIENPIINTPLEEPTRHFRFTEDGITSEIVGGAPRLGLLHAANPGLLRIAHKMATGSGKTVVMGMLIACASATQSRARPLRSPQPRRLALLVGL
jgi:hypothetical protein